jgi:hypothetical protein
MCVQYAILPDLFVISCVCDLCGPFPGRSIILNVDKYYVQSIPVHYDGIYFGWDDLFVYLFICKVLELRGWYTYLTNHFSGAQLTLRI